MIPLESSPQVWLIHGNLGGGKSMTAVSMAVEAIRAGRFVASNIKLNIDALKLSIPWADQCYAHFDVSKDEYNEDGVLIKHQSFNPFKIPSGSPRGTQNPKRVLVIFDECAEWFDQYSSAKSPEVSRVMSWLRHSSKRNQDVLFIVQRVEYLQKSFRILCSRYVQVDDLAVWRLPVFRIRVPFMGGFVMARTVDRAGTKSAPVTLIKKSYYGRYYDTAQSLTTFGGSPVEYVLPDRSYRFPWILFWFWISSNILLFLV